MYRTAYLSSSSFCATTFLAALNHNNYLNSVELNRESELYLVFEAEFVPDQLEFFPDIVLASWVESYRSFMSYILLNYLGSSGESFANWDLSFSINQLQLLFATCQDVARDLCRPSCSIREVRQRMSTVADSSLVNVTNLRDVIDVPVPVIDVGDSSLRVPSLLSDEPTLELSGILSTNSVMIPVAPYQ